MMGNCALWKRNSVQGSTRYLNAALAVGYDSSEVVLAAISCFHTGCTLSFIPSFPVAMNSSLPPRVVYGWSTC